MKRLFSFCILTRFCVTCMFYFSLISCYICRNNNEITNDGTSQAHFITDSLDNIIAKATDVKSYKGLPLIRNAEGEHQDSLIGFPITKGCHKLNRCERAILSFILSEKNNWEHNYTPIRQPFNPDMIIKFVRGHKTALIFISFGSGELAIADKYETKHFYRINNVSEYERLYKLICNF